MEEQDKHVFSVTGEESWKKKLIYLFEVDIFSLETGERATNLVTDPYSISRSMNSERSQIVNIKETSLQPEGWNTLAKPPLERFEDIVIYELHVRDFSASEPKLTDEANRGTFLAFTESDSLGVQHLKSLATAGLTHVHLLPSFDFGSVDEDKTKWQKPTLPDDPKNLEGVQQAITLMKDSDGFNWGYDPVHFMVPEGSYSTDAQGSKRILEMRQMVNSLNKIGLRVIMDTVMNHTYLSDDDSKSILNKIVPGYFYRLDRDGKIQNTTCCPDTASEHAMMEKLMVDTVLFWAKNYKIDGFRFDLMGPLFRLSRSW